MFKERSSILKAYLTVFLIVSITSLFSYPGTTWYLSLVGGISLVVGILLKIKRLIPLGVIISGGTFYLSHVGIILSLTNVAFFIMMFIFFYASMIYLNEMIKRDIIRRKHRGDLMSHREKYEKNWRSFVLKKFSLSFFLSLIAFIILRTGKFGFWEKIDNFTSLVLLALLVISLLSILYFLFLKLPTDYLRKQDSR
ncbi:MAG: hypothetical protein ACLFSM_02720 [Thermoplasmata archaeon]